MILIVTFAGVVVVLLQFLLLLLMFCCRHLVLCCVAGCMYTYSTDAHESLSYKLLCIVNDYIVHTLLQVLLILLAVLLRCIVLE